MKKQFLERTKPFWYILPVLWPPLPVWRFVPLAAGLPVPQDAILHRTKSIKSLCKHSAAAYSLSSSGNKTLENQMRYDSKQMIYFSLLHFYLKYWERCCKFNFNLKTVYELHFPYRQRDLDWLWMVSHLISSSVSGIYNGQGNQM